MYASYEGVCGVSLLKQTGPLLLLFLPRYISPVSISCGHPIPPPPPFPHLTNCLCGSEKGRGNGGEIHQRLREKRAKKRSTQGANQGQGGSGLFQRIGTAGENQCVDRARRSKGERRGNTIAPNRRGRGGTNDVWGKGGEGREKKGNTQENEKFIRTLGEEAVDVENNMGSSAEMEEGKRKGGERKGVTAAIKAVPAVDLKRRERERERKGFLCSSYTKRG